MLFENTRLPDADRGPWGLHSWIGSQLRESASAGATSNPDPTLEHGGSIPAPSLYNAGANRFEETKFGAIESFCRTAR